MSGTTFIFRCLPKSFPSHLQKNPKIVVDLAKATRQHENFRRIIDAALKNSADRTMLLPAVERFPSSFLVEDTCFSLRKGVAIATSPLTDSRRGESGLFRPYLETFSINNELDAVYNLTSEFSGGSNCLCIGNHLFVGQAFDSMAFNVLQRICSRHDMSCTSIPVKQPLKSVVSWLNKDIGLVASSCKDGLLAAGIITKQLDVDLQTVHFVKHGASMMRVNKTVIHEPGLFLRTLRRRHEQNLEFVECDMRELAKMGAKTMTSCVVPLRMSDGDENTLQRDNINKKFELFCG